MSQTSEQKLLSKLYDCHDEIEKYLNNISLNDIKESKRDFHYKSLLTLLSAKKGLGELISKLETTLCDKQELM